ncbi:MAG: M4 family peptidase [Sphingobacteriaceae bacterium]|nr:MAG: M4 family peptidase [Sphingobacteriaceae bacterium]
MKQNHSPHFIIPPYMIAALLSKNEENVSVFRANATNLQIDEQIRSRRKLFGSLSEKGRQILAIESVKDSAIAPNREVYTANHQQTQPGKLARKEGQQPVADEDVNNAYDAAGYTFSFYYDLFGRNSIDNKGLKLIQTVHYSNKYDNAFWDGQQMIFGDGDGKIFASFTKDIDVIGHELTHGVVQYECNLDYQGQSGALNESLADVFGIMIKQRAKNQDVTQSDWLIGESILIGDQYALRSFKAPGTAYVNHPELGTDPQPSNMSGYFNDPYDNGGVHTNSGITNHAFYLAATAIGGFAWEKTGKIWYAAMCDIERVKPDASFIDFKNATVYHAQQLFTDDASVAQAVEAAWNNVGVKEASI